MFLIGDFKSQPNSTISFKANNVKQTQSKKGNVFYEMQATIVTMTDTTFDKRDEVKIWFNLKEAQILQTQILKLCKSANDYKGLIFSVDTDYKGNLKPYSLRSKCFVDCINFLQQRDLMSWDAYWYFFNTLLGCDDSEAMKKLALINLLYKLDLIEELQINSLNDLSKVSYEAVKQRLKDIHVNHKYKYNINSITQFHDTDDFKIYSVFYAANLDFSLGINSPFTDEEIAFIEDWQVKHFEKVNRDLFGDFYDEIVKF